MLVFIFIFFRAETPTKRTKTATKQAKTPEMRFSCKTVNFFNTVINNTSIIYSVSGHLNQTSSRSLKNTIGQNKNTPGEKNPFGLKFQPEQLRAEKAACGRPRYIYDGIYIYDIIWLSIIYIWLWCPFFGFGFGVRCFPFALLRPRNGAQMNFGNGKKGYNQNIKILMRTET